MDRLSFERTDGVKTVYPPTNTVCWGYNYRVCNELSEACHERKPVHAICDNKGLSALFCSLSRHNDLKILNSRTETGLSL